MDTTVRTEELDGFSTERLEAYCTMTIKEIPAAHVLQAVDILQDRVAGGSDPEAGRVLEDIKRTFRLA